jgi:hypothetical protein
MGRPEAMNGKNDDEIIATAIAYEVRRNAPKSLDVPPEEHLPTKEEMIQMRLDKLYGKKTAISQDFYL